MFVCLGEQPLDDVTRLKDSPTVVATDIDRGGTGRAQEDQESRDAAMGIGKNNTSKTLDSSGDGGKYEEESKDAAEFYPIPVILSFFLTFFFSVFLTFFFKHCWKLKTGTKTK